MGLTRGLSENGPFDARGRAAGLAVWEPECDQALKFDQNLGLAGVED